MCFTLIFLNCHLLNLVYAVCYLLNDFLFITFFASLLLLFLIILLVNFLTFLICSSLALLMSLFFIGLLMGVWHFLQIHWSLWTICFNQLFSDLSIILLIILLFINYDALWTMLILLDLGHLIGVWLWISHFFMMLSMGICRLCWLDLQSF